MDKHYSLSEIGTKLLLRHCNNMDISKDAAVYIDTLYDSLSETEVQKIRSEIAVAEEYVNNSIKSLSPIPFARIHQYLKLLENFDKGNLRQKETEDRIIYLATQLANSLDDAVPSWKDINWKPRKTEYTFKEYAETYHGLLGILKNELPGSNAWLDKISELLYICYNIGFYAEEKEGA